VQSLEVDFPSPFLSSVSERVSYDEVWAMHGDFPYVTGHVHATWLKRGLACDAR
jgi:hypothetical protein